MQIFWLQNIQNILNHIADPINHAAHRINHITHKIQILESWLGGGTEGLDTGVGGEKILVNASTADTNTTDELSVNVDGKTATEDNESAVAVLGAV